ncbi:zinc-dependent metalloprotease [Phytoactinopolyspora alkaliphila]|uniref:Zinc-dependent metalloprotease n=1 Tax=Phytoactinopolyspora alkaliphila TaxID=1783498 RepID=A0A6N9YLT8_9ACTN|nr:zinc-dependent metalloprotease [Phytoactinopolyspora alkaliphila]NED95996.1 zinc-dependent metalloprotease [Phytoactinopolyspora alkaliphila]
MTTNDAVPEFVDWDLAARTARRLAGPGPSVTESEARQTVADLRRFAAEAEGHVRGVTGLDGSSAAAPVAVVDRGGWATANTESLRTIVAPLAHKIHEARRGRSFGPLDQIGPKATGLETGLFLAFIAARVLGQFDPFFTGQPEASGPYAPAPADGAGSPVQRLGRLLLVAPNVVHVERELEVHPADFRLWVCLHEETHRVQFTAVPWLSAHLEGEIQTFVRSTQVDTGALAANLREVIEALLRAIRGDRDSVSLMDLLQSPEQKAVVKRVTALMSLLEGHADVIMDRVGPEIIPSVETIRRRFQNRRKSKGMERTVRRALGFEAKMRQYRDGGKFVNEVVDSVGMTGFNRVWESAETLPTPEEIAEPAAWVQRVHRGSQDGAGAES